MPTEDLERLYVSVCSVKGGDVELGDSSPSVGSGAGAAVDDGPFTLLSPTALLSAEDTGLPAELGQPAGRNCRPWLRWVWWGFTAMVLVSLAIVIWVFQKKLIKAAFKSRGAILQQGCMGVFLTQIIFLLWVVLMLPTTGFEVLVAFTYGFPISFAISMIGKTSGSIAVFAVARRFLKERARNAVSDNVVLSALMSTAERHSFWTVSIVRLAYIPLSIKNLGLSAFPVSATVFSTSTLLFNIPYAVCWCWLGSTLPAIADNQTGELHLTRHWQATVALGVGLTFTGVLFLGGMYYTRRLTRKAVREARLVALASQASPLSSSCLANGETVDSPVKPMSNLSESSLVVKKNP